VDSAARDDLQSHEQIWRMSVCVCLCVFMPVCVSVCVSVCLFLCVSVRNPIARSLAFAFSHYDSLAPV
jgi:hypothetical protein